MLHAWEKYGLKAAEDEFFQKYDRKSKLSIFRKVSFAHVVKGKIEFLGMVRGKDSTIYRKYYSQLCQLEPRFLKQQPIPPPIPKLIRPRVITEGETDWKHLEASLAKLQQQGLFIDVELDFHKSLKHAGGPNIKTMCMHYANTLQDQITIFVFDNDDPKVIKDVSGDGKEFKSWNNNVFSFVIPVPVHRILTPEVCIEMYYKDTEIARKDSNNRRLFLSNEFQPKSGKHKTDKDLNCTDLQKIKDPSKLCIIDDRVFNGNDENVALPKNDFADSVLTQTLNFNDFDHSEFSKIFDVIRKIIIEHGP